jgi:hypothetical protein
MSSSKKHRCQTAVIHVAPVGTKSEQNGVKRHFTSFSAAAEEAGLSRIYAGQHFRTDHIAGQGLGGKVAESIVDTILLPK